MKAKKTERVSAHSRFRLGRWEQVSMYYRRPPHR